MNDVIDNKWFESRDDEARQALHGDNSEGALKDARLVAMKLFDELEEDKQSNVYSFLPETLSLIVEQRNKGRKWTEIVKVMNKAFDVGLKIDTEAELKSEAFRLAKQVDKLLKESGKRKVKSKNNKKRG